MVEAARHDFALNMIVVFYLTLIAGGQISENEGFDYGPMNYLMG